MDSPQIDAWASHKRFRPEDGGGDDRPGGGGRNEEVDFRSERRSNETHESSTDPEARLSRKSAGSEAKLAYMTHVMMENRSGLIVDVETTESSRRAEREAALAMIGRRFRQGATIGVDRGYDSRDFMAACRKAGVARTWRASASARRSTALCGTERGIPGRTSRADR